VSGSADTANISVDRSRCQGTGYCEQLAPGLFHVDDEGIVTILKQAGSEAELELARQAEDICPTRAIALRLARE
jgi:ferredoxin